MVLDLGEEYHLGDRPYLSNQVDMIQHALFSVMVINCGHVIKMTSGGFLHCRVLFSLSTLCSLEASY